MESFFAVLKTECFYNAGELTVDVENRRVVYTTG